MEKVIDIAKAISGKEKIPLYLSESEIRRLDREEAVEEGIEQGIQKNRSEMILKMYNDDLDINTISKYANISVYEVQNIINSNN